MACRGLSFTLKLLLREPKRRNANDTIKLAAGGTSSTSRVRAVATATDRDLNLTRPIATALLWRALSPAQWAVCSKSSSIPLKTVDAKGLGASKPNLEDSKKQAFGTNASTL